MAKRKRGRSKKTRQPAAHKRPRQQYGPLHPWRICPIGQHWVRTHDVHCEPGPQHSEGTTYVRHGHCHSNPSHKDQFYPQEMENIAKEFFPGLTGPPAANDLEFDDGNKFDDLIRGWTKYWNEILDPKVPLDPDLVKALIATESGFNPTADTHMKGSLRARGLMQVTDGTRKTLRDKNGELADHLLILTDKEIYDPNLNIAAGIRWLFQKQKLASHKLKRDADWMEAVLEYKGMQRKPRAKQEKIDFPRVKADLREYYNTLKKAGTP